MTYNVLFVEDWLNFSEPDEEGFINHIKILKKEGIPISRRRIVVLARAYNVKLPLNEEISKILQSIL